MKNNRFENKDVTEDFFEAMGTEVSLKIVFSEETTDERKGELKKKVRNIFEKNEKTFSRFRGDSELSKINLNLGVKIPVSPQMLKVLLLCERFHELSNGFFDPRVISNLKKIGYKKDFKEYLSFCKDNETRLNKATEVLSDDLEIFSKDKKIITKKEIDTTGIVKGYTVDLATKFLQDEGLNNFIVDAGGDMFAQGLNQDGEKWKIGIEGLEEGKTLLEISNLGIATSGISRKRWKIGKEEFHHLINPKNPSKFSFDLKTVTVIEEKTVEADGRAKSLFLMGRKAGLEFANKNEIKALFLDYNENVYLSEKIQENVV